MPATISTATTGEACVLFLLVVWTAPVHGQDVGYPPRLPGGKDVVTVTGPELLEGPAELADGVKIARTAPVVDFLYYPGQDRPGNPWSNWGDGVAAGGKYYSAIGDHGKPKGTALVYEFDPATKRLRTLVDLREFLESSGALAADENFTPGKIHTRVDMGRDGWLYYAGHRGSTKTTDDAHGFRGVRIYRTNPETGKTEVVAAHVVPKHVIPMSVLDPERMIFYGGTKAGEDAEQQGVVFLAYDVQKGELLKTAPDGPDRYAILAQSTGRLYWGVKDSEEGRRYDPATNEITSAPQIPHVRSATRETPDGFVYGTSERSAELWRFNVKTEEVDSLGSGAVGAATYVTSIDADPRGRYLYYVPGAHGQAERDGTPVVQYDVKTKTRKVICFLNPALEEQAGYTPGGTFSTAVGEDGATVFVTWNGYRTGADDEWDVCGLTAIHVPESERRP